jgi:hypothetical protein
MSTWRDNWPKRVPFPPPELAAEWDLEEQTRKAALRLVESSPRVLEIIEHELQPRAPWWRAFVPARWRR